MAHFRYQNIKIRALAPAVPENKIYINGSDSYFSGIQKIPSFQYIRRSKNEQTTSDLGFIAADHTLNRYEIDRNDIGFIIFISRTPDYRSPATATVLNQRLKLAADCIAYDVNIGGAGFFYGLQIGSALLENINKRFGLVITGDTCSKLFENQNQNYFEFGDGACAILLEKCTNSHPITLQVESLSQYYKSSILKEGGFRTSINRIEDSDLGYLTKIKPLICDTELLASLASSELTELVIKFLAKICDSDTFYDYVLTPFQISSYKQFERFHAIKQSRFIEAGFSGFDEYGDSSGNTIPRILSTNIKTKLNKYVRILSAGIGEGISLGIADFSINEKDILPLIFTDEYYMTGDVSHDF